MVMPVRGPSVREAISSTDSAAVGRRPLVRIAQAQQDGRTQQPRGWINHCSDPHELPRHHGVDLHGGQHPLEEQVADAHRHRSGSHHFREIQVGADGCLPGHPDFPGRGAEEASWQAAIPAPQTIAQHHRLDRRDRHALPVDGVEAAHRIADYQQPVGRSAHLVVTPPAVGRNAMVHHLAKGLGRSNRFHRMRGGEIGGERDHVVTPARRLGSRHGADTEHPGVVFVPDEPEHFRPAGLGEQGDHVLGHGVRGESQQLTGILELDDQLVLPGAPIPESLEKERCAGAAAGRVDDQIGGQRRLAVGGAIHHLRPGDAATIRCGRQGEHVVAFEEHHVVDRLHAATHIPFEDGPARKQDLRRIRCRARTHCLMRAHRHPQLGQVAVVPAADAGGLEVLHKPGEEFVENSRALCEGGVDQPPLRDASPVDRIARQDVPLDHRHPAVEVGQHAGGQQAAHTRAEHYCMTTALVHGAPLTRRNWTAFAVSGRQGSAARVGDYPNSADVLWRVPQGLSSSPSVFSDPGDRGSVCLPCAYRGPAARRHPVANAADAENRCW